jgi:hypothetical protein
MAPQRSRSFKRPSKNTKSAKAPKFESQDSDAESESGSDVELVPLDAQDEESEGYSDADKDEVELKLEKLVFGDSSGFRENLRGFAWEREGEGQELQATTEEDAGNLTGFADADVSEIQLDKNGTKY